MRNQRGVCLVLSVLVAVMMLSGCGEQQVSVEKKNPYATAVSMEPTPVIDYVMPRHLPNIMVDCQGYAAEREKTAVIRGSALPEEFALVEDETGKIVYRGPVEKLRYHEDKGLYSGSVDFSDFRTAGTYYLVCDTIGQSLRFVIQKEHYAVLFLQCYGTILEECRNGGLSPEEAIQLLQAYECHRTVFPDDNNDGIPDVLAALKAWILGVEERAGKEAVRNSEESEEMLYAAFLAKFSFLYQSFDHSFATDCLKRASTVYGQRSNNLSKDADSFRALTELYRATGHYTYRQSLEEYNSFFENNESYLGETGYLYGTMTYLSTRQKVDVAMCDIFMENIMERAEQIANRSQEMIYPYTARNNGADDILKRATEVFCANYVMSNYRYTQVVEEFLHYLMGCNIDSVDFYSDTERKTDYLLLLSQLLENHRK